MNRRNVKYLVIVVLLGFVGWYTAKTLPQNQQPFLPIETLIASEQQAGWRVVRPPDLAGPYRREGQPSRVGRGQFGAVTYRGPNGLVTVKLSPREDVEQTAVLLQTESGGRTVIVLEK